MIDFHKTLCLAALALSLAACQPDKPADAPTPAPVAADFSVKEAERPRSTPTSPSQIPPTNGN